MSDDAGMGNVPTAIERLAASGPFPPSAEDLMLYGRLVGAWDVEWEALGDGGAVVDRRPCAWHFAWVLGGRGVQDVIWVRGAPRDRDGTTLRCWDHELRAWRVVFMSPADGEFVTLIGRRDGASVVQDVVARSGRDVRDGLVERWTFSDITEAGFAWRAECSTDGGRTWTVTHRMRARRAADDPSCAP